MKLKGVVRSSLMCALLAGATTVTTVAGTGITPAFATGSGTVSGKVFNDKNVNGAIASSGNEGGVPGINVKAYDSTGAEVGSTTTGADGTYTLTVSGAASNDVRIEFTNSSGRFVSSVFGPDNGTDIQFVTLGTPAASNVKYGVQVPGDFCVANNVDPLVVAARMSPNSYKQGLEGGGNCYNGSLVSWPWYGHAVETNRDTCRAGQNGWNNYCGETDLLRNLDTGATYGLAYDKVQSLMWASAFVRRHAGLGPEGVGGLYVTAPGSGGVVASFDLTKAPWNLSLVDPSLDLSDAARGLDDSPNPDYTNDAFKYSQDAVGFGAVGKQGIGDIAIDSAYGYLYLTNLYQKKVQRLNIGGTSSAPTLSGTGIESWSMPPTACSDSTSDARPFGMYFNEDNNRPWVGIVCTKERTPVPMGHANQATGLVEGAAIWELNPTNGTWVKVTDVNLNYPHRSEDCPSAVPFPYGNLNPSPGSPEESNASDALYRCWSLAWHAWTDDWDDLEQRQSILYTFPLGTPPPVRMWYAQPMLSGISRLGDGSIVVGITDRLGFQTGYGNLKPTTTTTYTSTLTELVAVAGDILLLCKTGSTYTQETNGACTSSGSPYSRAYSAPVRPQAQETFDYLADPNGQHREFFADNIYDFPKSATNPNGGPRGDNAHIELSNGSVAVWPPEGPVSAQQVAFTAMDPAQFTNTGGVRWNNASTGEAVGGENLDVGPEVGGFDKSANMGNLEIICDAAPVQIGNRAWRDSDEDGIQDPGETPLAGVTVRLYDEAGVLVGTAVTDAKGQYFFASNVSEDPAGDGNNIGGGVVKGKKFTIKFDNPDDYKADGPLFTLGPTLAAQTAPNGANSPAVDSNLRVGTWPYIPVTAGGAGQVDHTYDAGFKPVSSVGSRVWVDANKNGIQDAGEPGFPGAKVELLDTSGNPANGTDGFPAVVYTDSEGNYVFGGLEPGDYKVKFTVPAGVEYTEQQAAAGTSKNDSNPDTTTGITPTFTLAAAATGDTVSPTDPDYLLGEFSNPTIDAGVIVNPVAINGVVRWEKRSPGAHEGNQVSTVDDYDSTLGYDPYHPAVVGVIVELFDENENPVRDVSGNIVPLTYTDYEGNYWFDNLLPGKYKVKFTAPAGTTWSPSYYGSDPAKDSNAANNTDNVGWTDVFDVLPGAGTGTLPEAGNTRATTGNDPVTAPFINDTIDALLVIPNRRLYVSMGSKVWYDDNKNGIQDNDEDPAEGVKVEILDPFGNPIDDSAYASSGNPMLLPSGVGPAYTDQYGNYEFTYLVPGRYTVRFTAPNGYAWTTQFAGGTETTTQNDSNADPFTGVTPLFPIDRSAVGDTVDRDDITHVGDTGDSNNEFSNPTIDAGLIPVPVGVGNYTWFDTDGDGIQDPGEPPIAGVKVEIVDRNNNPVLDIDGNPVGEVYTDANGYYFFDNLRVDIDPNYLDSAYAIKFTPPPGYTFTKRKSAGSTAADDSDAGVLYDGWSDWFDLGTTVGSNNMVIDTDPATKAVFVNPTIDAGFVPIVAVGDYVWFDTNRDGVQGPKERGIAGITVYLENTDGTDVTDASGNIVSSTTTDDNGKYFFDNLVPGSYRVYFSVPASYSVSPQFAVVGTSATDSNMNASGPDVYYSADFTVNSSATGDTVADTAPETSAIFVDPTIDAGIYGPKVGFGDKVWVDANSDGIQDAGEPPLAGVRVYLTDADGFPVYDYDGNIVVSTLTDANGNYKFDNLVPGAYRAKFLPPPGYVFTWQFEGPNAGDDSNANESTGITPPFRVAPGATNTSPNSDGSINADFFNPTIDAGVVPIVALGNYVWIDKDRDGTQELGEAPIGDVKVELFYPNGDPALDADGNTVSPVYTDGYGYYLFDNLRPGDYKVKFTPPQGYIFTSRYSGSPSGDSNADTDGMTDTFTIGGSATGDTIPDTNLNTKAIFVNPTIDAGVVPLVAIGNYTWYDLDKDGLQDQGEPPIAGVGVELLDVNGNPVLDGFGNPVAPTTTDDFGYYLFDGVPVGTYTVRFTPPAGYTITKPVVGSDPTLDSDASNVAGPDYGLTLPFTVSQESVGTTYPDTNPDTIAVYVNPTIDAGLYAVPVAVGNYVWIDSDRDGLQYVDEPAVPGVKVELLDANGNAVRNIDGKPVLPVFTDAQGRYFFDNLAPASYRIRFTPPPGYGFTDDFVGADRGLDSNPDPYTGLTPPFSIAPTATGDTLPDTDPATKALFVNPKIDAGLVPLVAIGNYTWIDLDADGIQDNTEPVLANVKVELLDSSGNPALDADGNEVAPVFTDANGKYLFDNLLPGTYKVRFTPPTGYTTTPNAQGTDSAVDSNPDPATGVTPAFEVCASCTDTVADIDPATQALFVNPTIDAGFIPVLAVGNYTWFDRNANGVQDTGEYPVSGVKVELFKSDGSAAKDADGNTVASVFTDSLGYYIFDNLPAGDYYVKFTAPDGYDFTTKQAGTDAAVDSNPFATGVDLGKTPVFSLCPLCTGTTADTEESTKALWSNLTIDAGFVGPPLAVGNYVWIDKDGDGIQDNGEQPLDGVQVELLDVFGQPVRHLDGTVVGSVLTDGAGKYVFDNLPAGEYTIRFTPPPGYTFTRQQVASGTSSNDSNPDLTGLTPVFSLTPNTSGDMSVNSSPSIIGDFINPTIDAGVVPVVAIGNYVWLDENSDGKQTLGERAIQGAKVELFNPDMTPALDANGDPVASVLTDVNGFYLFDNLPGGTYVVKFTPPTGYGFTAQFTGSNKGLDSNADRSTGITPPFTVCPDCVNTEDDLDPTTDAIFVNPTIDAGLVPVFAVGNYVWVDTDEDGLQDSNERGIAGVGVQLLDSNGNPATDSAGVLLPTVYTDDHGFYLFDNLAPGTYQVKFTLPAGFSFTGTDAGDDTKDSDADTGTGKTAQFNLCEPCPNMVANSDPAVRALFWNPTLDAGIVGPAVAVGDYVWQDANRNGLQEADEVPMAGVKVELLDVDGNPVTHVSGAPVASVTTGADGGYVFDNIPPGQYKVRFTLPNGYRFTENEAPLSASDNDSNPDPATGVTPVFTVGAAVGGDTFTADADLIADLINPTIDAGVVPRLAVGDYVWIDLNRNGIQDAGEAPLPGTKVELFDAQGNAVLDDEGNEVAPEFTDASGFYAFDKLLPGNYVVRFTPPAGYVFTSALEGGDRTVDSNAGVDGWTAPFELCAPCADVVNNTNPAVTAARINPTIDAGVVPVVAVGDYTWFDTNKNGQQDRREARAAGVRVQLYSADGLPAVDADGHTVPEIVTDANGHYLFDNLLPGDYRIRFLNPWGAWYTSHRGKTGTDSNPLPEEGTGWTAVFNIAPGVSGDTTADANPATRALFVNLTIDAGFIDPDLPVTGSDSSQTREIAMGLGILGLLLIVVGRRRRRTRLA